MSELKARTARSIADEEEMLELGADCPIESAQVYLKSEADKVIAELKNEIEEQKRLRNMALSSMPNVLKVMKIIQHHKYKRCLAMAQVLEHILPMTNRKAKWRDKWHKRWLKIAEQFKEAK